MSDDIDPKPTPQPLDMCKCGVIRARHDDAWGFDTEYGETGTDHEFERATPTPDTCALCGHTRENHYITIMGHPEPYHAFTASARLSRNEETK